MGNFRQDVRYALRTMRKAPGFAAVAVITLALGIGANTAIFTAINALFFRSIPVQDPKHLVSVFTTDQRNRGGLNSFLPVSNPNADDIQHRAQSFSGIAVFADTGVSLSVDGQADRLVAEVASGNFFDVLGVPAAFGRIFKPEDDRQLGAAPIIVLSNGLWQRKFASNRNVIGKSVLLNGLGFTIIGVAPRGFQGTAVLGGPDMWVPMCMHEQIFSGFQKKYFNERRFLGFAVVARLKDGVSEEKTREELKSIGSNLESDNPIPNKGRSFTFMPLLQASINPNLRDVFTKAGSVMMAVVGLVLLIACANITNLLLARAAGRKREISVRLALGASRSRIITQLLTESIMLSLAGGALGLGVAVVGRDLLWKFRPPFLLQANLDLTLDTTVLIFTSCIAIGAGVIFGLAPALQSSRPDLVTELKERAGGEVSSGRRFKLRDVFMVVQVALSLLALIGAGMFLFSLHNAQKMDPGFDTHNLGMISFDLGSLNYDPQRAKEFQRRVLETAQAVPGVKAATLAANIPLFGGGVVRSVFPEGAEGSNDRNGVLVGIDSISADYLQTMGIPMIRGQGFDSSVREDSVKVVIVNEAAARRFWPDADAVGKRFKFFGENDWRQVIGVARDSKYVTLGEDPTPNIYLPLIQNPGSGLTLFFRTTAPTNVTLNTMRTQVQMLDRNLPLTNVWPIGEVISQALWASRFGAGLLTIFALVALVLCAVGIYGVVGYSVGQHVREIGIRMALGAQPRDVLLMVLRQSAITMGVGLLIGLAASFMLGRWVVSLLYGVSTNPPLTLVGMAMLLACVGFVASYIPARRAATVDPLIALRKE